MQSDVLTAISQTLLDAGAELNEHGHYDFSEQSDSAKLAAYREFYITERRAEVESLLVEAISEDRFLWETLGATADCVDSGGIVRSQSARNLLGELQPVLVNYFAKIHGDDISARVTHLLNVNAELAIAEQGLQEVAA